VADTNVFQLSQPGAFADPLTEGERCWRRPSRPKWRPCSAALAKI
jgi:hypothetical protein